MAKPLSGNGRHAGLADRGWYKLAAWCGWEGIWPSLGRSDNGRAVRYYEYRLNARELIVGVIAGVCSLFAVIYLFYHSVSLAAAVSVLGLAAPRLRRAALLEQRRNRLKLQFKDALFSLISSLAAGRSLENAFRAALEDLKLLYADPATDILRELQMICYRLDNAEPLESALRDWSDRARIDDITQFVDVLATCKRSGGDLLEVMRSTSAVISEKLTVDAEIQVMIARKKFEARIMMAVPFLFLGFLGLFAPDYMAPLYSSGAGAAILTAALLLLLGCFWIIHRFMNIRI